MTARWLLLATLVIGVGILLESRYTLHRFEIKQKQFFDRASRILSLVWYDDNSMTDDPISEDIKLHEGNLIDKIRPLFPTTHPMIWIDPYSSATASNRMLELRYGQVDIRSDQQTLILPREEPVWFVASKGLSVPTNSLTSTMNQMDWIRPEPSSSIPKYTILAVPYHPSNGIVSQGFFYLDSLGNRIGKANP